MNRYPFSLQTPASQKTVECAVPRAGQRSRGRRNGYLLLSVLFVMVLCGLLFASFANHSLEFVTDVNRRAQRLQDKWARACCTQVGQRLASTKLARNALPDETLNRDGSRTIRASFAARIVLNGIEYEVAVADESAKLDINFLLDRTSRAASRRLIQESIGTDGFEAPVRIALRPLDPTWQDLKNDPLECWGQVFELSKPVDEGSPLPPRQAAYRYLLAHVTPRLTLWGQKVNYLAADETTVHLAVEIAAGNIMADRVCEQLRRKPRQSLPEILRSVDANQRQARQIRSAITDRSRAVSIRVRQIGKRGRVDWLIIERYGDDIVRERSMVWE